MIDAEKKTLVATKSSLINPDRPTKRCFITIYKLNIENITQKYLKEWVE